MLTVFASGIDTVIGWEVPFCSSRMLDASAPAIGSSKLTESALVTETSIAPAMGVENAIVGPVRSSIVENIHRVSGSGLPAKSVIALPRTTS